MAAVDAEIRVLKSNINQAKKELDKCQENLVQKQLEDSPILPFVNKLNYFFDCQFS